MLRIAALVQSAALLVTLFVVGIAPMGCKSDTERAASTARTSVGRFRENLDRMPANIDRTMNALGEVAAGNNTNRAATFREFSREFQWMQERAAELGRQADRATANSQAYFREWAREGMATRDAEERRRVEQAIADRRVDTDPALRLLTDARRSYGDFANRLRDIQDGLRNNLTQENIDAMGPAIERVRRNAMDVQNLIARLGEQLDAALLPR